MEWREIASGLCQDAAHDKVGWNLGNVQSHLQTSHHARPYSVELGSVIDKTWIARAGVRIRYPKGERGRKRGRGFYEEREIEIRREKGRGGRKLRGLTGLCTSPKKRKIERHERPSQLCPDAPVREDSVM
jgi:hypothetical protein